MKINQLNEIEFIERLTNSILADLEDENLSVKDLAEKSGMAVHAINQKLYTINKKHLNQFIREIRLKKASKLLQSGTYTAAEAAYRVGFSSPAYFNKCFHDYYGYPPGRVKISGMSNVDQNAFSAQASESEAKKKPKKNSKIILLSLSLLLIISAFSFESYRRYINRGTIDLLAKDNERISVAVMPFRNITSESSWNIWQEGIQSCLVNSLSNSAKLVLLSEVSINEIIKSNRITDYAALKPELAGKVSRKLGARVFVYGNITKAGLSVRLNARLIDSRDEATISSIHIDGSSDKLLDIIDSLSVRIHNVLVMSEFRNISPAETQN